MKGRKYDGSMETKRPVTEGLENDPNVAPLRPLKPGNSNPFPAMPARGSYTPDYNGEG